MEEKDFMFDAYSVIRSEEIREYFRREDCMDIFEKEQLILYSYLPIEKKTEMLKQLSRTGGGVENRMVAEMCHVYERYISLLRHPETRTVFLLEYERYHGDRDEWISGGLCGAFDTVEEAVEELGKAGKGMEKKSCGHVTVLHVPQNEKVKEAFRFRLLWMDGEWRIKDLYVTEEELEAQGVSTDTAQRFRSYSTRHPLPFENGCRLRLFLPFMEEPVCGTLERKGRKRLLVSFLICRRHEL